jgi:hypothetical protein
LWYYGPLDQHEVGHYHPLIIATILCHSWV